MLIWTSAGTTRGEDTVQNQRMFIYLFYSFWHVLNMPKPFQLNKAQPPCGMAQQEGWEKNKQKKQNVK